MKTEVEVKAILVDKTIEREQIVRRWDGKGWMGQTDNEKRNKLTAEIELLLDILGQCESEHYEAVIGYAEHSG